MNRVYLLLGSNEGDRRQWLQDAMGLLIQQCGTINRTSAIYQTAAWGLEDQPDFYNMALELDTALSPTELLQAIQDIEQQLGRQRVLKWGQRTLDIDVLFYNQEVLDTPELKIPHPYLQERRFALAPLNEIAPTLIHPVLHQPVSELLALCPDPLPVEMIK